MGSILFDRYSIIDDCERAEQSYRALNYINFIIILFLQY